MPSSFGHTGFWPLLQICRSCRTFSSLSHLVGFPRVRMYWLRPFSVSSLSISRSISCRALPGLGHGGPFARKMPVGLWSTFMQSHHPRISSIGFLDLHQHVVAPGNFRPLLRRNAQYGFRNPEAKVPVMLIERPATARTKRRSHIIAASSGGQWLGVILAPP